MVPQLDNLDTTLTVEQNLIVFTYLYRVPQGERREAIERALQIARLGDRRDAKVDELSGGMRRRLLIARALVHRPRLVLLDEPTVGLDPQIRQELWALIDALRAEGTSILMSTHYIEEAQRLADTVTIMSHGKAVAVGQPQDLIREHAGTRGASRSTARRRGSRRPRPTAREARPPARAAPAPRSRCWRRQRQRRLARGRPPRSEPRGRLRAPDRGGARAEAAPASRRCARLGRLEWPGHAGRARARGHQLLVATGARPPSPRRSSRRSTCSPSASASARWSRTVGGVPYIEFVGTGTVATAVCSPRCSRRCSGCS